MPDDFPFLVVPRPGSDFDHDAPPIRAPDEEVFTSVFGQLFPPVKYTTHLRARIAYYSLPPLSPRSTSSPQPDNVLILHGGQTPSLGLLPLAKVLQSSFPASNIVLADLPGHGLSDTTWVPHTPDLLNGMINALLSALTWDKVHLIGFSLSGAAVASYVSLFPQHVSSYVLMAPAGLLPASTFRPEDLRGDDEREAERWLIEWLEPGGKLVVPGDWKERVARGEVVPPALRDWENKYHPGHRASVVGFVRDGGCMDAQDTLRKAAGTGKRRFVVVGELDPICDEGEMRELGYGDIAVLKGVGHPDIRDKAEDVGAAIAGFWRTLEG